MSEFARSTSRSFHAILTPLCIAVGVAFGPFDQSASAQPYSVRAATRVQTSGFGICDPQFHDDDSGQVQAPSVASGPFTATSTPTPDGCAGATCTAYAFAELGVLHGYANFSAATQGAPSAGSGQATTVSCSDTITVVSDTLPMGSQVTLAATLTYHRTISGTPGNNTFIQTSTSGPFGLFISDSFAFPDSTQTVTATTTQFVGSPFTVTINLNFQAAGTAFAGAPDTGSINVPSVVFTLVPQTPGATYTTASGANYVPLLDADLNNSGHGDGMDIAAFVSALINASTAANDLYHADFDGDGIISLGDLSGFTQKLLAP